MNQAPRKRVPQVNVLALGLRITIRRWSRHRAVVHAIGRQVTLDYTLVNWLVTHCVTLIDVKAVDRAWWVVVL